MSELRFVTIGAGFWTGYQLAGWREVGGAKCVAIANRTVPKAEQLARRFGIPHVYDDAEQMLQDTRCDFVDIVSANETHEAYVRLAADHGRHVICQKPLAPSADAARALVDYCTQRNVRLMVHENWRFQHPIREAKRTLDSGAIGDVFRGRVTFACSFPVFDNQPFLATLDRFILTDIGTHILDTCRYLFGDMTHMSCLTRRVNPKIQGEDVATCLMQAESGAAVTAEMSYASVTEHERFPQTFLFVEGSRGSIELSTDYWLHVTTRDGTTRRRVPPPRYAWADPAYDVVHASIAACNAALRDALVTGTEAETSGADNAKTLSLVDAAYLSAERGETVRLA